jgi:hypothetical protein
MLPLSQVLSPRDSDSERIWSSCSRSSPSSIRSGQRTSADRLIRLKVTVRVRIVAKHRLAHQQLVEIGVDQRPHDRVDLPLVVVDTGGDVDHGARW